MGELHYPSLMVSGLIENLIFLLPAALNCILLSSMTTFFTMKDINYEQWQPCTSLGINVMVSDM